MRCPQGAQAPLGDHLCQPSALIDFDVFLISGFRFSFTSNLPTPNAKNCIFFNDHTELTKDGLKAVLSHFNTNIVRGAEAGHRLSLGPALLR